MAANWYWLSFKNWWLNLVASSVMERERNTHIDEVAPPTKPRNIRPTKHEWFHEYKVASSRALTIGKIIHALGLPLMQRKWSYVKN